jgi:hypothetical protein
MAKPKIALVPSAQGSKFYSVLPSSGVGDFTFSRSGSATRINSQGLIETVSGGESRLNYPMIDGKVVGCPHHILEPQRSNVCGYSDNLTQWSLTNGTLSANSVISPDGTLNADRVVFNNNALDLKRTVTVTASTTYTYSFYIKLENGTGLQGRFYDNSNSANIEYYDYSEQVIGTDWTRVTRQVTTPSGCTQMQVWLLASSTSLVTASFWGVQLEVGGYETSYIPTPSAAIVTRSAETATGSGNADTFNDSEGVLMAEISALADDGTYRILSLSDGTTDERVYMQYTNVSNTLATVVKNGAVTQANISYILPNETEFSKLLFKYKSNDFALWVNGFEVGTDTSGNTPIGLSELAFDDGNGANDFYGNTKQLQYYDSALTDSELEQLTSWVSFSEMAQAQQYSIQ